MVPSNKANHIIIACKLDHLLSTEYILIFREEHVIIGEEDGG